jgi:hypothetical protein
MSTRRSLVQALAAAVALYGFAAWVYVALVALVEPRTLTWQLTHLAKWPRTDTFGEIAFVMSFLGFVVHRVVSRAPTRE